MQNILDMKKNHCSRVHESLQEEDKPEYHLHPEWKGDSMKSTILVGYATRYGSTKETAEVLADALKEFGYDVVILPLREVHSLDGYQAVVLGAPLFMFRWHKDALKFLVRHQEAITRLPVAVFALGPTHDPHVEQEWKDSKAQLKKELANLPWFMPDDIHIFGGRYDPSKLGFPLSLFAGRVPASDMTDLDAVRKWAGEVAQKFISPDHFDSAV